MSRKSEDDPLSIVHCRLWSTPPPVNAYCKPRGWAHKLHSRVLPFRQLSCADSTFTVTGRRPLASSAHTAASSGMTSLQMSVECLRRHDCHPLECQRLPRRTHAVAMARVSAPASAGSLALVPFAYDMRSTTSAVQLLQLCSLATH